MTDIRACAEQLLNFATERGRGWETRTERGELTRVVHSGEWEGSLARCCDCNVEAGFPNHADAEFIAAAPGLVRDLLDALTEAQAEDIEWGQTEADNWERAVAAEEALDEALAAIERVRELHQGEWLCINAGHTNPDIECPDCAEVCTICHQDMPCDTIRALDGGEQS